MKSLTRLRSVAAPLFENAIDTDVIFPARFLLLLHREGLGQYAFNERRQGKEPFILDVPPYDNAEILVTGEHFGTGSSREQAVWALGDLGIRCVIARSFGEIFFANCFKNGMLPIRLDGSEMVAVERAAKAAEPMTVDLDSYHKRSLLAGLDEVGMILAEHSDSIAAHEARREEHAPWLGIGDEQVRKASSEEDAA